MQQGDEAGAPRMAPPVKSSASYASYRQAAQHYDGYDYGTGIDCSSCTGFLAAFKVSGPASLTVLPAPAAQPQCLRWHD